jgi:hypothetical protein
MAKVALPKPARSHGYGAILFFTFVATLGGCGLILWELSSSYKFETKAKLNLRKVDRTTAPVAAGPTANITPPAPGPVAPMPEPMNP